MGWAFFSSLQEELLRLTLVGSSFIKLKTKKDPFLANGQPGIGVKFMTPSKTLLLLALGHWTNIVGVSLEQITSQCCHRWLQLKPSYTQPSARIDQLKT